MSDIFASLAAGTARPTATQGSGETVVRVVDPSPDLARLASGDSLRGTVVGGDQHGHLQVRTLIGVLTLSVQRPLPVGTAVELQVRSVGPQGRLHDRNRDGEGKSVTLRVYRCGPRNIKKQEVNEET